MLHGGPQFYAAALLHDIGHLAPGSHTAFKTWFPNVPDSHEDIGIRIINETPEIQKVLARYSPDLQHEVTQILNEDEALPAWTWEIISGGGWNVDRGNWCTVDSVMAGVTYGEYNIPALIDSVQLLENGHLALNENRLDAMMHFMVSRHAMYRQIYQHRVLLASDMLNRALVQRIRDCGSSSLGFCDAAMKTVLELESADDLPLNVIFTMRECWWRYHLITWLGEKDKITRDLADRLINRRLFKTLRVNDGVDFSEVHAKATKAVQEAGYDPTYYLHTISTIDVHKSDSAHGMAVQLEDGSLVSLAEADPIVSAMGLGVKRMWLALPGEAKEAFVG